MTARRHLASDLKLMLEIAGVEKMPDVEYMAALVLEGFAAGAYRDERVDRALTATEYDRGLKAGLAAAAKILRMASTYTMTDGADPVEWMARIIDARAIDGDVGALTATGPGSGGKPGACGLNDTDCYRVNGAACPGAPQTDHRAVPACGERHPRGGGYGTCCLPESHPGVAHRNYGGDEWDAAAPPSGIPPGAAGACVYCKGVTGFFYCPAGCGGTGRRPPESPDGSRGTR